MPMIDSLGAQRWEEIHSRIIKEPPREGREYINHALKLVSFIEPISEVHPVAKALVSGFKAVLALEQIREENDMRVAAVFFTGTDTMRVFLDISEVATTDKHHSTLHPLKHDFGFEIVLRRIQVTIRDCGNSVDTYYKQSRLAKFYKAQEWKIRMAGYIDDFKSHRVQLQEALSLYTASNVNVLVTKMSDVADLVSRLFATKPEWEKTLATKTQCLGDQNKWMEDDATLQAVVLAAEDPVLGGIATKKVESKSNEMRDGQSTKLSDLRNELQLSLEQLCSRNRIFSSRSWLSIPSNFKKLSRAQRNLWFEHCQVPMIVSYIRYDLCELWKEMSWIFCVDNKLFTSALFEYYLDHFSASRRITLNSNPEVSEEQKNASNSDEWTLEYIAAHGQQIAIAVDRDNSGFIRISEANAFTKKIPNGWSLPQWCAYTVAGWSYECRIYRKRMHRLLFKLMEMEAQVLPNNRMFLLSIIELCHPILSPLAWEPRGQQLPSTTIELRSLVKDKVHAQDAALRAHLDTLQWNIEDESVLRLLYGDVPLEKYILQLCTLVLEQALILAEISCTLTLETKEWYRFIYCQRTIRKVVLARVTSLSEDFAKNKDTAHDPKLYFGGIWSSVDLKEYMADRADYPKEYTSSDVADYHHDLSLLDDFPLPSVVEGEPAKRLKYKPWEEHIKSMNAADVPMAIPSEWDPTVAEESESMMLRTSWCRFPLVERGCDVCRCFPIVERYYGCLVCEQRGGFDLCASCYNNKSSSEIEIQAHKVGHPMVKWTLDPRIGMRQWMELEANMVLECLRTKMRVNSQHQNGDQLGDRSDDDDNDENDNEDDDNDNEDDDNDNEGDDEENEGEDDVGVIAAGAAVAAELGDETGDEIGNGGEDHGEEEEIFPDGEDFGIGIDEAMENPIQDADETDTSANQPKHEDLTDPLPGGAVVEVVQDPLATPSPYMCGRCSESIDWDHTFYRCIGHSCRGASR
ncbi:hypothetical protein M413DRAFT_448725 [Hebeloma cylindrosporum]|uniref:ZZ-type domain-containing protein n=1 Tax=Hebeloma cylindrosporum TaxID=76867 RepID=A0A0C3C0P8_HEBCY|nr:hypothetical protein M413DRAFT_448725 [Hebeloma cylindrosporum h7]